MFRKNGGFDRYACVPGLWGRMPPNLNYASTAEFLLRGMKNSQRPGRDLNPGRGLAAAPECFISKFYFSKGLRQARMIGRYTTGAAKGKM